MGQSYSKKTLSWETRECLFFVIGEEGDFNVLKVLDTDVSIMLSLTCYENSKGGGIIWGAVSSRTVFLP